ncbi:MAG: ABC transporter substrate-binding protein [Chloroflexota bacterium]
MKTKAILIAIMSILLVLTACGQLDAPAEEASEDVGTGGAVVAESTPAPADDTADDETAEETDAEADTASADDSAETDTETTDEVVVDTGSDEIQCPEGENITLTFAAGQVGTEGDLAREGAAIYEEACPNVTITFESTSDSATQRSDDFRRRLALGDDTIDLMQIDVVDVGILADNLLALNDFVTPAFYNSQFQSMVAAATVDDSLYAFPWLIDTGHLYYRTDLLEKYGLEVPTTWDDLEAAAEIIQEGERADGNPDFTGFVWQGNTGENLTTNALEWQVSHDGGRIMSEICSQDFDNDGFVNAMERAAGWVGSISPVNVLEFREEESRAVWNEGNAAFMRNWFYAYGLSADPEGSAVAGNFDITVLPQGPGGQSAATLGGQMIAVSGFSTNPEAAVLFAAYLTSRQEQKRRALTTSLNPTYLSLYEDPDLLELYPPYPDLLDTFLTAATPRPSTELGLDYNQVSELYYSTVYEILNGSTSASGGARDFTRTLEDDYLGECGDA